MDNSISVKILHSRENLNDIALNFKLCEPLSPLKELIKGLIGTDLEQNIHVFLILKHMLKTNNVGLVERLMNLDFRDKFLTCSAFGEGALGNYLGSK